VENAPSNIGQANGLSPRLVGSKDSHREQTSQEYRHARVPEAVVQSSSLGEEGIGCIPGTPQSEIVNLALDSGVDGRWKLEGRT